MDKMDEVLDEIEEVLKRHFGTAWEIMSVDGDEEGMSFTVSGDFSDN